MKKNLLVLLVVLTVVLLTSSCQSPAPDESQNPSPSQSSSLENGNTSSDLADQSTFFEIIGLTESILAPGSSLQISTEQAFEGDVTISSDSAKDIITQSYSGSSGIIDLPSDITDGLYILELSDQAGIKGITLFRISSGPGVWLSSSQRYTSPSLPTLLKIRSHLVPEDSHGAIYLTEPGGNTIPLIPDENGNLSPGLPLPVTEFMGRNLYLDNSYNGSLQFRSGVLFQEEDSAEQELTSNIVNISDCQIPTTISGNLSSSGYINAIWINGEIISSSLYTENGAYQMEIGPGFALIQTITETADGYQSLQQVLGDTCGEVVELSTELEILSTATRLPGGAKLASPQQNSKFLAASWLPSASAGEAEVCRRGLIDAAVTIDGQPDPGLSEAAGLALKQAILEKSPQFSAVTQSDIVDLLDAAAQESLKNDGEVDLEQVTNALATDFMVRLTASTLGDSFPFLIRSIKTNQGDQEISTTGLTNQSDLARSSSAVYADFAEEFSHTAFCGQVDPEKKVVSLGEEVQLEYTAYDLSGARADGAEVTISEPQCGAIDPQNGSTEGGIFESRYQFPEDQFCTASLDYSAKWYGPVGNLETKPGEAVAVISPQLPEMTLSVGYVPGIGSQNANIVETATFFETWDEARAPGGLPPISQSGACNYIEGGKQILNDYWYQTVSSSGKRAESSFSTLAYTNLTDPANEFSSSPVDHFLLRMQTYAYAVPVEDNTPAREASAFAGNGSIISMDLPSTVFLININNPGELPITPIVNWRSSLHNDDGSYSSLIFYKIINCGTDAGLGSYSAFLGGNIQELYYFDSEEGGATSGLETLPEITNQRSQVLLYIIHSSVATSIRDDEDGIYFASMNKLTTEVDIYLSQETTGD